MRNTLFIITIAMALMIYFWIDDTVESPELQGAVRSTPSPSTQTVPKPLQSFPVFSTDRPLSESITGFSGGSSLPSSEKIIPAFTTPAAAPTPQMPSLPIPADPRWQEVAAHPTQAQAKPVYIGIAQSQDRSGFKQNNDDDWKRGSLTLQGSYGYHPLYSASPTTIVRVTLTANLNCQNAQGVLYFRDMDQRIEWLSSAFPFDARILCSVQQEQLNILATDFNLDINEIYTPATAPLIDGDSGTLQDGYFNLRFVSGEASSTVQSAIKFCLVMQGGTYAYYLLPQNRRNPSAMSECTFLDSFTLQRNLQ